MPYYSFRNKETGEEYEEFFSIAGKEIFLEANPHIEQFIGKAPALHSGRPMSGPKVDDGFKEVLNKMKKIPGNTIKT